MQDTTMADALTALIERLEGAWSRLDDLIRATTEEACVMGWASEAAGVRLAIDYAQESLRDVLRDHGQAAARDELFGSSEVVATTADGAALVTMHTLDPSVEFRATHPSW
jgi:hypothetical protein